MLLNGSGIGKAQLGMIVQDICIRDIPFLLDEYQRMKPLNMAVAAARQSHFNLNPELLCRIMEQRTASSGRFLHVRAEDMRIRDVEELLVDLSGKRL